MKKDIHPKYYKKARVICACGNSFFVGSTKEHLDIEICSKCHPFYTGKDKMVDKMGRVERFRKRLAKKQTPKKKRRQKSVNRKRKTVEIAEIRKPLREN